MTNLFSKKTLKVLALLVTVFMLMTACASSPSESSNAEQEDGLGNYPEKELEVVYHSKAGGGGDIFLRTLGKAAEPALDTAWIVNNVTGAAGSNAWNYVSKADADGYTILGVSSTFVSNPVANKLPVSYKDFEPIAMLFVDPVIYYCKSDKPYESMNDVIEAAKAAPGEIKVSGGTAGGTYSIAHTEFVNATGVDMPIVPFEGGADQLAAVLGGHIEIGIGNYADVVPNLDSGDIRVLVTFNKMDVAPEIPDMAEIGYPEVQFEALRGLVAPKGTPEPIIDYLVEKLQTIYDDEEFKVFIEANSLIPSFKPKAEFTAVFEKQTEQVINGLNQSK